MSHSEPSPPPASPLTLPHVRTRTAIVQLLFVLLLGILAPFGPALVHTWSGAADETPAAEGGAAQPGSASAPAGSVTSHDLDSAGHMPTASGSAASTQPGRDKASRPPLDSEETASRYSLIVLDKSVHLLLAGGLLAILLRRRDLLPAGFGITGRNLAGQVGWGMAAVLLVYYYLYLTMVVIISITMLGGIDAAAEEDLRHRVEWLAAIPPMSAAQAALLMGLVAAHEEVVFRGLLLPYLRRLTGSWVAAVAISCGVFGVLHIDQGVIGAAQAAGIGMVLAIVFIRTRSLLTVTLAHFVFNFVQLQYVAPALFKFAEKAFE